MERPSLITRLDMDWNTGLWNAGQRVMSRASRTVRAHIHTCTRSASAGGLASSGGSSQKPSAVARRQSPLGRLSGPGCKCYTTIASAIRLDLAAHIQPTASCMC